MWEFSIIFRHSPNYFLKIYNSVIIALDAQFNWLIKWHPYLTCNRINHYARMLNMKLNNKNVVWGWLNSTFISTYHSEEKIQRLIYSGYKKRYKIKWQKLAILNNLISSLSSPWLREINNNKIIIKNNIICRIWEINFYLYILFN